MVLRSVCHIASHGAAFREKSHGDLKYMCFSHHLPGITRYLVLLPCPPATEGTVLHFILVCLSQDVQHVCTHPAPHLVLCPSFPHPTYQHAPPPPNPHTPPQKTTLACPWLYTPPNVVPQIFLTLQPISDSHLLNWPSTSLLPVLFVDALLHTPPPPCRCKQRTSAPCPWRCTPPSWPSTWRGRHSSSSSTQLTWLWWTAWVSGVLFCL